MKIMKMMSRKEYEVEMRWKLSELVQAVKTEEDATRRREKAQTEYDIALGKLLAEVPDAFKVAE